MVYQIRGVVGAAQWMADRLAKLAADRQFTEWGVVRWHTAGGQVEQAQLCHCQMVPLGVDEEQHERAVLWGQGLQLALFGAAAVQMAGKETTPEGSRWQLVVVDRMAMPYTEPIEARHKGRTD